MNYKVTIQGKTYELPARTLSVDDKIESVAKIDQEYRSGEITPEFYELRSYLRKVPEMLQALLR